MHSLEHALGAELDQRRVDHLYRQRNSHTGPQTPELTVNGQKLLAFCSNDYLGLANHPQLISAAQKACIDYGLGSGASHLVVGHTDLHHELEQALAEVTQRPRGIALLEWLYGQYGGDQQPARAPRCHLPRPFESCIFIGWWANEWRQVPALSTR